MLFYFVRRRVGEGVRILIRRLVCGRLGEKRWWFRLGVGGRGGGNGRI